MSCRFLSYFKDGMEKVCLNTRYMHSRSKNRTQVAFGHMKVIMLLISKRQKTALDKVINCSFPVKWTLSSLPLINYILLVKTLSFSVPWYKFSHSSNVDSSPATQHLVLFCFKAIKFTIFKISNHQTCFHYFCFKLVYQVGLTLHTFWISWMKLST